MTRINEAGQPSKTNSSEFGLGVEAWAELNTERYQEREDDPRVIGFEHEDMYITNPFMDESGRFSVDPQVTYGSKFATWMNRYDAARMDYVRSKDSHS